MCSALVGVVLPGDMLRFPFVFKSPNAGVFSEQWEFQTHPVVAGGAKLLVTLRGVALKRDKFERHRAELEVCYPSFCTVGAIRSTSHSKSETSYSCRCAPCAVIGIPKLGSAG